MDRRPSLEQYSNSPEVNPAYKDSTAVKLLKTQQKKREEQKAHGEPVDDFEVLLVDIDGTFEDTDPAKAAIEGRSTIPQQIRAIANERSIPTGAVTSRTEEMVMGSDAHRITTAFQETDRQVPHLKHKIS